MEVSMKIFNVRLGLATNSSSSHSLIFLKEGIEAFDYAGYHHATEPWQNTTEEGMGEFGWQRFTLTSRQAKMHYLGVMLKEALYRQMPDNIADLICEGWLPGGRSDGYIDHQSLHQLPNEFNTNMPDERFFFALKDFFGHEKLAILGGNDNEEARHTLDDGTTFNLPVPKDCGSGERYVCRYDEEHDFWTLFHPHDGRKIRFRFTADPTKMNDTPKKASAPELVDIKITDFCPYNCDFCYQSSTVKGEHANSYEIYKLASALGELKVFEVALGGGEPTLHPEFGTILRYFREAGIVPNFTTKNLNWLRDPKKWIKWLDHAGAFAYSANDEKDIAELATLLDYNGIEHQRANIHIVMGTVDEWKFTRMMREAQEKLISVTLLGYKRFGFGLDYEHIPYHWWISKVMERADQRPYGAAVSIDTVLAKEYEDQILAAQVPSWLFTTEEGQFSCYIDAVKNKMGPSSYCGEDSMIDIAEHRLVDGDGYMRSDSLTLKEIFSCF
jgi:hypothetical protein